MRPFVERELDSHLGANWLEQVQNSKSRFQNLDDPQVLLTVMWDQWNAVFRDSLGYAERSLVSELRTVRNDWAHNKPFGSNDAVRALDSMERLLSAVSFEDTYGSSQNI